MRLLRQMSSPRSMLRGTISETPGIGCPTGLRVLLPLFMKKSDLRCNGVPQRLRCGDGDQWMELATETRPVGYILVCSVGVGLKKTWRNGCVLL